jgi:predicted permease
LRVLWQDLRFAARMLAKNAAFTTMAVVTLAVGIGANTAIFSIVNSLLIRPLPVKDAGQIMALGFRQENGPPLGQTSYTEMETIANQPESPFSTVFGYQLGSDGLSVDNKAFPMLTNYVTGNYFETLGLKPVLGRLFLSAEGKVPGADPVIVLGYAFWQTRFAGDPAIVGRKVLVDGHPFTVIGVAPEGFHGLASILDARAFLPLAMFATLGDDSQLLTSTRNRNLRVLARIKRGISLEQARAAMAVIAQRLSKKFPDVDKGLSIEVVPEPQSRPDPSTARQFRAAASLFLALAGLVLLLACINVANLLLVRGTVRQREMAIRAALGGSRSRLIRSLLTESLLLGLIAGAAGLFLGELLSGWIASIKLGTTLPVILDFSFDERVFVYALSAALLTGVVVGIIPALRASRGNLLMILHEAGRSVSAGRQRLRSALVVAQVAGSLMLLVIAGLFTRSMENAQHMNLGFEPSHLLNLSMDPATIGYDETQGRLFFKQLLDRAGALPGVESASLAFSVPMGYYNAVSQLDIPGYQVRPGQPAPVSQNNNVSPGYFRTMRIPLLRGRDFDDADTDTTKRVAIINEAMAQRFWANQDPIGRQFVRNGRMDRPIEVIGIVQNSYSNLLSGVPQAFFYLPFSQDYISLETLQVRTTQDPKSLAAPLQKLIASAAATLPVFNVQTMSEGLYTLPGLLIFQVGAGFAAGMGLLGLILAAVGVYGVVSYVTAQRTHEIGIRLALGAQGRDVLHLVLRQGVWVVLIGVATGLLAALAAGRVVRNFLVGVGASDPLTYFVVSVALVGIALLACWVPARRATRVDPLVALRYE